jgi:hypothetical protein
MEVGALQSALGQACIGVHSDGSYIFPVGAKAAQGNGRLAIQFSGVLHRAVTEHAQGLVAIGQAGTPELAAYAEHLKANRAGILTALKEAAE